MRPLLLLALLTLLPAGAAAQAEPAPGGVALPPELDRVLRDYERAWRDRDPRRLADLFHDAGHALPPGNPPLRGRTAISRHYRDAGGPLHLRALAYATSDTVGYIVGMYGHAPDRDAGKFLLAMRRSSRTQPWLIAADMDNSISRPEAP
jgi:hypothetical protein